MVITVTIEDDGREVDADVEFSFSAGCKAGGDDWHGYYPGENPSVEVETIRECRPGAFIGPRQEWDPVDIDSVQLGDIESSCLEAACEERDWD